MFLTELCPYILLLWYLNSGSTDGNNNQKKKTIWQLTINNFFRNNLRSEHVRIFCSLHQVKLNEHLISSLGCFVFHITCSFVCQRSRLNQFEQGWLKMWNERFDFNDMARNEFSLVINLTVACATIYWVSSHFCSRFVWVKLLSRQSARTGGSYFSFLFSCII